MKYCLVLFLLICSTTYGATQYYVDVDVVTGNRIGLFKLKDGNELEESKTCVSIELTKEDYDVQNSSDYDTSQTQFTNWLKIQVNADKIDSAVYFKNKEITLNNKIDNQKTIMAIDEMLKTSFGTEAAELTQKKIEIESQ